MMVIKDNLNQRERWVPIVNVLGMSVDVDGGV